MLTSISQFSPLSILISCINAYSRYIEVAIQVPDCEGYLQKQRRIEIAETKEWYSLCFSTIKLIEKVIAFPKFCLFSISMKGLQVTNLTK